MTVKIAATALAVTLTAATIVTASTNFAEAANGKNAGAFAAGAIIGLATGAIVGSRSQPRYHRSQPVYGAPVRSCHREAVHQWNPYQGRYVVTGYRKVCY